MSVARPLVAALLAIAAPVAARSTLDSGWWVVLGTSPTPDNTGMSFPAAERAAAAARRCGVEPFGDFSAKFIGFAPGYYVTVAGAFASRAEAQGMLARLRRCVPGAYLRRGAYAGE